MNELTKDEMESVKWFLTASIEEILERSVKDKWDQKTFNLWMMFKIAQNLEKIVFKEK